MGHFQHMAGPQPIWPSLQAYAFLPLGRYLIFDVADPYKCHALLNRGSWLDDTRVSQLATRRLRYALVRYKRYGRLP